MAKVKILSLNIEGQSMAKFEHILELIKRYNVDILLLQETFLEQNSAPPRFTIDGYALID